jgi:hypothetical protein
VNAAVGRRGFLRVLGAAPIAAQALARAVGESVLAPAGAALARMAPTIAPPTPGGYGPASFLVHHPKLLGLHKLGLLPDWAKATMIEWGQHQDRGLDPDVVALRSVSLSAKVLINERRRGARLWERLDKSIETEMARKIFFDENAPSG